jgi:hypothetical protein
MAESPTAIRPESLRRNSCSIDSDSMARNNSNNKKKDNNKKEMEEKPDANLQEPSHRGGKCVAICSETCSELMACAFIELRICAFSHTVERMIIQLYQQ